MATHFTSVFIDLFLSHTKVRLTPRTWRHAAVAIANQRNINIFASKKEAALHLQAGHRTTTA
jgi:hypothetical protein